MSDEPSGPDITFVFGVGNASRDVPARQILAGLEGLIAGLSKAETVEEKIRLEVLIARYKLKVRTWAKANGLKIPSLDDVDLSRLERLAKLAEKRKRSRSLLQRETDLQESLAGLRRMRNMAQATFRSMDEFLHRDPRVNPATRDRAKRVLLPQTKKNLPVLRVSDSADSETLVRRRAWELEEYVKRRLDASDSWTETCTGQVDATAIESTARTYLEIRLLKGYLAYMIRRVRQALLPLKQQLDDAALALTAAEQRDLDFFANDLRQGKTILSHLSDLELTRVSIEKYLSAEL